MGATVVVVVVAAAVVVVVERLFRIWVMSVSKLGSLELTVIV